MAAGSVNTFIKTHIVKEVDQSPETVKSIDKIADVTVKWARKGKAALLGTTKETKKAKKATKEKAEADKEEKVSLGL